MNSKTTPAVRSRKKVVASPAVTAATSAESALPAVEPEVAAVPAATAAEPAVPAIPSGPSTRGTAADRKRKPTPPAKAVSPKPAAAPKARPKAAVEAWPLQAAASKPQPKAAAKASAGKVGKKAAKPRVALVRDSFTMPQSDFALIATLKSTALVARRAAKKSELLRAGLHMLSGLDAQALAVVLDRLETVKTGRPKKGN
jgi:hypothetical protein